MQLLSIAENHGRFILPEIALYFLYLFFCYKSILKFKKLEKEKNYVDHIINDRKCA